MLPAPDLRRKVSRQRQDELNLLQKVWNAWVSGLLGHSLHQEVRQTLGLTTHPDAVLKPWGAVIEAAGDTGRVSQPDGLPMTTVFDQAQGRLLILGAAGAGKTTLLLELARELIVRARRDEGHPLPLVFSLSSWAHSLQPFADWLADEMNRRYDVPYLLANKWVATGRILPLLDGLDEVGDERRVACLSAILAFDETSGGLPLVICTRTAEYEAAVLSLDRRLRRVLSLELQPLRPDQVDGYLADLGDAVAGLREAFARDEGLQKLAATPLMLSLLILTYHDERARRIPSATKGASGRSAAVDGGSRRFFAGYVARMMERGEGHPSRGQILGPLEWMARTMNQRGETIFYVENLQPDWPVEGDVGRKATWIVRVVIGVLFGLLFTVLLPTPPGLGSWLLTGVLAGVLFGWLFGGVDAKASQIAERAVNWSWGRLLIGMAIGVALGWVLMPIIMPIFRAARMGGAVRSTVDDALFGAALLGMFGAMGGALNGRRIGVRSYPNQGIWRTALHAVGIGVVCALGAGLGLGLVRQSVGGLRADLSMGLFFGLLLGLGLGVAFGGTVVLRHVAVRFLLSQDGSLPWGLVPFLDDAADRLLLRKVGGGYVFVHRRLQDYIASLESVKRTPSG